MRPTSVPVWPGSVVGGVFRIAKHRKEAYVRWTATLPDGDYDLTVKPREKPGTLAQDAFLHAVVYPAFAAAMGDSVEGVKLALMGEKYGYKLCPITKRELPVRPRTSSLTAEEKSEFIDWVIPFAAGSAWISRIQTRSTGRRASERAAARGDARRGVSGLLPGAFRCRRAARGGPAVTLKTLKAGPGATRR